ncbi:MAG: tyrosine-type recombinase/integrase [Solirubrobacteraceae bacterium]
MPGFHRGRPPRDQGLRFPADPPTVEEIVAVMRCAGDTRSGLRTRALIIVLWRAGLRISEALSLAESDLDAPRGSILVRRGKGGRRREVGLDVWGWQLLEAWLEVRRTMRIGALLCVIEGPTQGRPWSPTAARATLRRLAVAAGVRRRFAPHQLRHAHAVEMAREGVSLVVIQRQLGHANLGITSVYLQGIDSSEIIDTVHRRPAPVLPASAGLR